MVVVTIIIVRVILKISCEMCDRDKPNIAKINNSSDINGNQVLDIFENVICVPSVTKKITEKKSFSDFILPPISRLYGKVAKAIPAKNAPIAIENPRI